MNPFKIPNLFAHIRIQTLQDEAEAKIEKATKNDKQFYEGQFDALTDAEFILRYASCYTEDNGFDRQKCDRLRKTTYPDGNQRYDKNENDNRVDNTRLPDICPNCKTRVEWDWEMANFYDEQITNDATCPECDAVFVEVMEVVSWEKKQN